MPELGVWGFSRPSSGTEDWEQDHSFRTPVWGPYVLLYLAATVAVPSGYVEMSIDDQIDNHRALNEVSIAQKLW